MTTKLSENAYMCICSKKTLQSNQEGFFMSFAENVAIIAGDDWINNVFGKLNTDQERIRMIYESEVTKNVICDVLSNVQEIYRKKDPEVSQARRIEAEKALKCGNKLKSLILYSQSVIRAPKTGENTKVDNGFTLALALWGRAQVLIEMKKLRHAITDIQLALEDNLPCEIKSKAYWKLAFCYQAIGEYTSARQSFDLAEEFIEYKGEFEKLKHDMETLPNDEPLQVKNTPSIVGPTHPAYPNSTNKMRICQSERYGRYAVANAEIKTGETIVVEPPYAACLLQEAFGTHCHHCFERLIAPIGCPDCASVAFCKKECRDIALSTYHNYECKFLDLLIGSGMSVLSHLALRMITQHSLERSLELYADRSKEKIYSLCTNSEKRQAQDFFQRTLMAAFLLRCLQKCKYFSILKTEDSVTPSEQEYKVGELILFHLQMLQFNAHEIYETKFIPERKYTGTKAAYIGVAVYSTVALFNHDCYPSVTRYFMGKNIVINTIRPVLADEVIAENYGPIFTRMSLQERQKSLQGRYWFDCKCTSCMQNWPSFQNGLDNVTKRIRCPTGNCTTLFTISATNEKLTCPNCQNDVDISENVKTLKMCEKKYELASELLKSNDISATIELLTEAIDTFHRISSPPHKETHLAQELLRTCFASFGNSSEIISSS